ncbi:MAG: anthranilate phosphoribosyltransferase [Ignavibacteriales bacterium]|nr:anthranilate phosphoribosyltransferase [Ignavibacteriales bacterium]
MIKEAIGKLATRQSLSTEEAYATMDEIMSGVATDSHISAFLMGLRLKGETVEEIAGCARAMKAKAVSIKSRHPVIIDTCGTGGDASGTFNISTAAAIIASAAGAVVAKHGNRAVSSRSGSADVLKALGVNIDLSIDKVGSVLDEVGITFLFAPLMHGAMKFAAPVRRDLGIRTIFNILGPLTNPAGAKRQLLGVFDPTLTETMAAVLGELGSEHALVVHGEGGFDELSSLGSTKVSELKDGKVKTYSLNAGELGIKVGRAEDLRGGDAVLNAEIIESILSGKDGAPAEIAVLNAGGALLVAGKTVSLKEGIALSREAIRSGAAARKLKAWKDATNNH